MLRLSLEPGVLIDDPELVVLPEELLWGCLISSMCLVTFYSQTNLGVKLFADGVPGASRHSSLLFGVLKSSLSIGGCGCPMELRLSEVVNMLELSMLGFLSLSGVLLSITVDDIICSFSLIVAY